MAHTYAELQKLTLDDLKREYDRVAPSTAPGLNFIRDEIARREAAEQNDRMLAFTRHMRDMTIAILILTIINVILAAAFFVKS